MLQKMKEGKVKDTTTFPDVIMHTLFNCFGYMLIGGVGGLLFIEYKSLSNYIKQLKQECKEYKLKLVELKENGLD